MCERGNGLAARSHVRSTVQRLAELAGLAKPAGLVTWACFALQSFNALPVRLAQLWLAALAGLLVVVAKAANGVANINPAQAPTISLRGFIFLLRSRMR